MWWRLSNLTDKLTGQILQKSLSFKDLRHLPRIPTDRSPHSRGVCLHRAPAERTDMTTPEQEGCSEPARLHHTTERSPLRVEPLQLGKTGCFCRSCAPPAHPRRTQCAPMRANAHLCAPMRVSPRAFSLTGEGFYGKFHGPHLN